MAVRTVSLCVTVKFSEHKNATRVAKLYLTVYLITHSNFNIDISTAAKSRHLEQNTFLVLMSFYIALVLTLHIAPLFKASH